MAVKTSSIRPATEVKFSWQDGALVMQFVGKASRYVLMPDEDRFQINPTGARRKYGITFADGYALYRDALESSDSGSDESS